MRLLKLVLVVCAAAAVAHLVLSHRKAPSDGEPSATAAAGETGPSVSAQGFVSLPALRNAPAGKVLIFAPDNCPREAGQRATFLEQTLNAEGIPTVRSSSAEFPMASDGGPPPAVDKIMMGTVPIVFVNGRAKNNPQVSEIEAEYRTHGH